MSNLSGFSNGCLSSEIQLSDELRPEPRFNSTTTGKWSPQKSSNQTQDRPHDATKKVKGGVRLVEVAAPEESLELAGAPLASSPEEGQPLMKDSDHQVETWK
jgi:hypothetical protein